MKNQRAVNRNRLLHLAAFLRALAPERFYYGTFIGLDWEGRPDLSCGTTACALGWAAAMPEFRALGVQWSKGGMYRFSDFTVHGRTEDWASVSKFLFGLTYDEAEFLFQPAASVELFGTARVAPPHRATAKQVANHVVRFVRLQKAADQ